MTDVEYFAPARSSPSSIDKNTLSGQTLDYWTNVSIKDSRKEEKRVDGEERSYGQGSGRGRGEGVRTCNLIVKVFDLRKNSNTDSNVFDAEVLTTADQVSVVHAYPPPDGTLEILLFKSIHFIMYAQSRPSRVPISIKVQSSLPSQTSVMFGLDEIPRK